MNGNTTDTTAGARCPFTGAEPIGVPIDRSQFDPDPVLTQLREQAPLTRLRYADGHVGWLVTSYELAKEVLSDSRFSVHPFRPPVGDPERRSSPITEKLSADEGLAEVRDRYVKNGRPAYEALSDPEVLDRLRSEEPLGVTASLLHTDPPRHTALRQMVAPQFTPRSAAKFKARVEGIVDRALDAMEQGGRSADLYKDFCQVVPAQFISALLGADPAEAHRFEDPTYILIDPNASTEETIAAKQELNGFMRELIRRKRESPSDDFLSLLLEGGKLSDEEIVEMGAFLFEAGHETTASMLGLSVMSLLADRKRWDALRTDSTIAAAMVEEMLRYHTVLHQVTLPRTALEDVEIAGVTIRSGEGVAVSLVSGNRDPKKFADPDRLDIKRKDSSGHLAFGFGIHQCLGQHFARLELQVGLTALANRFPGLELAVPMDEIPMMDYQSSSHGPTQLPVTW